MSLHNLQPFSDWPSERCERALDYCDLALECHQKMSEMSVVEENDHFIWVFFGLPSRLSVFYGLPPGLRVPSIWLPLEHDPSRGWLVNLSLVGDMDSVYLLFNLGASRSTIDDLVRAASDAYELSASLVFDRPSRPPSFDLGAVREGLQGFSEKIFRDFFPFAAKTKPTKMKEQRVEPPGWRPDFYR